MHATVVDHRLSGGRLVKVYDDVLPLKARQDVYEFAIRASYTIGWEDTYVIENRHRQALHASCAPQMIEKLGLLFWLAPTPIFQEISGLELVSSVINLSTPSDVNVAHAHPEKKVLLYYVNLDWRPDWYGETLFCDESLSRIDLALPYTPGRFVLFDGDCPHSIRPQSHAAPGFRFTMALLFDQKKPEAGAPLRA